MKYVPTTFDNTHGSTTRLPNLKGFMPLCSLLCAVLPFLVIKISVLEFGNGEWCYSQKESLLSKFIYSQNYCRKRSHSHRKRNVKASYHLCPALGSVISQTSSIFHSMNQCPLFHVEYTNRRLRPQRIICMWAPLQQKSCILSPYQQMPLMNP